MESSHAAFREHCEYKHSFGFIRLLWEFDKSPAHRVLGAPETNALGFTHVNVHQLAASWADRTSIDIPPSRVVHKLPVANQAKISPFAG
jgi:phosphoribosylformylglycinamidine (FGAM) synthase-like enzyme